MKTILRLFKIIYYLLYHQCAWSYDYVAALVSLGQWNNWVYQTIPFLNGNHILEIGFGPGHLIFAMLNNNKNIVGIDESKQMLRRASKLIRPLATYPPLIRGDVRSLPFPEGYFDQIASTFPADYIFNPSVIEEIYRVLTPGGELIILPFAWIKGKLWYKSLFKSQFSLDAFEKHWKEKYFPLYNQKGFNLSVIHIDNKKSDLIIIVATKPSDNKM